MPINTSLNVAPYSDDYDPSKKYYRVLFKPSVSVQTRELNQLQSMLQNQIEKFGDVILQRGTIVSGVNLSFSNTYAYAKLSDVDISGLPVVPGSYVGYYATSNSGVTASIKNAIDGHQATDPNLKTIYVDYISTGYDPFVTRFAAGDLLRIADSNNVIESVKINNPGLGFSNSDVLTFTPQVFVTMTSGNNFTVGEVVSQPSTNCRAVVVSTNTSIYSGQTLLVLKPVLADIANVTSTASPWILQSNVAVVGLTSNNAGTVSDVLGRNAVGRITTDGAGRVVETNITNKGFDYRATPYCTIRSLAQTGTNSIDLTALNYTCEVVIPSVSNAVGYGYAVTATQGIIYQNGYFLEVDPQTVIVDPYDQSPNGVSLIFRAREEIVDSNMDPSLLDNSAGFQNATAPGADRLKITPYLQVVDSASADADDTSLTIVAFSEGNPYKVNQTTVFSKINDEMARRTSDTSGDFAVSSYSAVTRSPKSGTVESQKYSVIVDPGTVYIDGYRVTTTSNFSTDCDKGVDLLTANSQQISVDYGNFVPVNEMGGLFKFNSLDLVTLYDTPKQYCTNTALATTGNVTPVGNAIGTARVRSLVQNGGTPGTNAATYNLYLFDVLMNPGQNFTSVRSISQNTAYGKGICDTMTSVDPVTGANTVRLSSGSDSLVFSTQTDSLLSINNTSYTYRTTSPAVSVGNVGTGQISLSGSPGEVFPYTGTLTQLQMNDLVVVPVSNNLIYSNSIGNCSINTTANSIVGTNLNSSLVVGDYIYLSSNGVNDIRQITGVTNSTFARVNAPFSSTNAATLVYRCFPVNVPAPFSTRSGMSANVSPDGTVLTLNFGGQLQGTTASNVAVTYSSKINSATPGTKRPTRQVGVNIYTSNNAAGATGPWCLGVPDVIRMTYVGMQTISGNTISAMTDVTSSFYVDNGQGVEYLGHAYLYLNPRSTIQVTNSVLLTVKFDALTTSDTTFFAPQSYRGSNVAQITTNDNLDLFFSANVVNSWEIPEFTTDLGGYYDLTGCIDFRPRVVPTANVTTGAVTINPANTEVFGNVSYKIPYPGTNVQTDLTYFAGRIDSVVVDKRGIIYVLKGTPAKSSPLVPVTPKSSIVIDDFYVPAYPAMPQMPSTKAILLAATGMASERFNNNRLVRKTIRSVMSASTPALLQPPAYSMKDIASLDRRIQNLEYYVSLSQLETSVTSQVIPSSIYANTARFMYGFFADDFSTAYFADRDNPEYSATLRGGLLFPLTETLNLKHGDDSGEMMPYVQVPLVSQPLASFPVNAPVTPCVLDNASPIVLVEMTRMQPNPYTVGQGGGKLDDQVQVRFASFNSNATLYFYDYLSGIRHEVWQGTTLVASSSDAVALNTQDKSYMLTYGGFSSNSISLNAHLLVTNTGYSFGAGKIPFVHNEAGGVYYTIKTFKGPGSTLWKWMLQYPIDSKDYIDCVSNSGGTPLPNVVPNAVHNTVHTSTGGDYSTSGGPYIPIGGGSVVVQQGNTPAVVIVPPNAPVINVSNTAVANFYGNIVYDPNVDYSKGLGAAYPYSNGMPYGATLNSVYVSPAVLAAAISNDLGIAVTAADVGSVMGDYKAALGRVADYQGLVYWTSLYMTGANDISMITQMQATPEGQTYGATRTPVLNVAVYTSTAILANSDLGTAIISNISSDLYTPLNANDRYNMIAYADNQSFDQYGGGIGTILLTGNTSNTNLDTIASGGVGANTVSVAVVQAIIADYALYLHRAPDANGLNYWVNTVANGSNDLNSVAYWISTAANSSN